MKPICVPCQRFFRPARNGIAFIEGRPLTGYAKPGTAEPNNWTPYKLWMGDKWECQGCGATIIVGCAFNPISEHYKPEFSDQIAAFNATLQINDC